MTLDKAAVLDKLRKFDFKNLFTQELGWEKHAGNLVAAVDGTTYALYAVAEKRGMQVFECPAPSADSFPDFPRRGQIERQVARSAHEHIIIYTDVARTVQTWQWVRREPGKPLARRETTFYKGQQGDHLVQKLQHLAFTLAEEESLSLVQVTQRARQAFDLDRVTKRFYDRFKTEHAAFLDFIKGIKAEGDRAWYASLMLNRLMFVYFIQKKGFLDGDTEYLCHRLQKTQENKGKDKFHSFYRYFLLRLFHEGLALPPAQHRKDLDALLGKVPYLNGGLFDVHDLETVNPDIEIADAAFERLFTFFDAYTWHLDELPLRADNEINPDVLGYIFEKYINQKQMGAYYTKEDITGYIARNTIIPFLFDAAEKKCAIAFRPESALWGLLRDDPDRYIYPAVRRGVDKPLPKEIDAGVNDVAKRDGWNKPAAAEFALPTETWREHVARRQRCLDLRAKLQAGEVTCVNDLITYNLDICQFAEDVIDSCEGPELLRAFYRVIAGHIPEKAEEKYEPGMSVLDPTCGSGAFLFAALNILEPLYGGCLDRMQAFVDDLERLEAVSPLIHTRGKGVVGEGAKYADFKKTLEDAARHPNRRYFILKSIIVNNLYGVDIMEEAVEICKLRMFLKLVSQVDTVKDLEPLPDIDFNIRPGNTLVGFALLDEVRQAFANRFDFAGEIDGIIKDARRADDEFQVFRRLQTRFGPGALDCSDAKAGLRKRLACLRDQLDHCLAGVYGVDDQQEKKYRAWHTSHAPFHWFAEFYGIMNEGGFDVIIGNPPWKEYAAVKKEYTIRNYSTESCGNLHCFCTERCVRIRHPIGRISFIVQLPMVSSSRMGAVRNLLTKSSSALHVFPFDDRPGKLFEGLQNCRSVIFVSQSLAENTTSRLFTSRYQQWVTEVRQNLFSQIEFARLTGEPLFTGLFPKYANEVEESLFRRIKVKTNQSIADFLSLSVTKDFIFYQEATRYWIKATYGLPYYAKNANVGAPAHGRYLSFPEPEISHGACAVLNSSLFYAYFIAYGDCFHLSDNLASKFPVTDAIIWDKALVELNKKLMKDLRAKAVRKTINTKDGDKITYDEFYGGRSKPIMDEIDRVLAKHYGFTGEELDFIINYDIKYRMGIESDDVENE